MLKNPPSISSHPYSLDQRQQCFVHGTIQHNGINLGQPSNLIHLLLTIVLMAVKRNNLNKTEEHFSKYLNISETKGYNQWHISEKLVN